MRRGLRGLVIVLGTLWVAASAGASTLLYANLWDGGAAPFERNSFLVDEIIEDYAGPLNGFLGAPTASYGRRSFVPYPYPHSSPMPGAPTRFGRRDFLFPPGPVTLPGPVTPPNRNRYDPVGRFPTLPVGRVLFHPLRPFPLGPFTGFDGYDVPDMLQRFFGGLCPNLLLPRDFAAESWQILRDLVEAVPYPDYPIPHLNFLDDWDSTLIAVEGLELVQDDDAGLELSSFEGTSAGRDLSGASLVVNAIPEPATGALLLAGLCALAARCRRC